MRDADQTPNCPGGWQHETIQADLPGTIQMFGGATIPTGWLPCDGRELKTADYRRLFAALSTTYGVGSVDGTFKLPDLRGRLPLGRGQGSGLTNRTLGDTGGEETHALTNSEYPPHTHPTTQAAREATPGAGVGRAAGLVGGVTTATVDNNTGGVGHQTMSRFLVVNFIIKT